MEQGLSLPHTELSVEVVPSNVLRYISLCVLAWSIPTYQRGPCVLVQEFCVCHAWHNTLGATLCE